MRRLWLRFANLFRGRHAEREMSREIEAHLALLREDFERRGMSSEEAGRAARRAFIAHAGGGIEQAKELHREARSFLWMEQGLKDLAYGWANLRRNPGFTVTAVIALALGIGVNATIFGIYNAVALKPLPVADPSRVVRIKRWFAERPPGNVQYDFAYAEYQYLCDHSSVFSAVVAADPEITAKVEIEGSVVRAIGYAVSANYFSDLGVRPQIGRGFLPDEDRVPGASPVVVLDYRFWQREFDGAASVLGRSIKLNGMDYTIVGVTPREFTGTESLPFASDFYAPLSMMDQLDPTFGPASDGGWRQQWRDSSDHPGLELLARLKPGISRASAQTETDLLLRRYLAGYQETDRTTSVTLDRTAYLGYTVDSYPQAAAFLAVVGLVLLVACANVANMQLARGIARQREFGIRLALGASRGRLIRQLLAESLLLGLLGAAGGALLSLWAGRLLWVSLSGLFQGFHVRMIELDLTPDAHVLVYALSLCLLAAVLSGLAPALQSTQTAPGTFIKAGSGTRRSRLRDVLVGIQVTVSVVLVVFGFAMAGALLNSRSSELGFDARDTYSLVYGGGQKTQALWERLETLPELSSVAIGAQSGASIGAIPLNGRAMLPMLVGKRNAKVLATHASDRYLETLGVRMLLGRSFTRQEARQKAPVAVISASTGRHFWPGEDPLGKHFSLDLDNNNKLTDFEVVGVAGDARFANVTEADESHVYLPLADGHAGGIVFRIRGDRGRALAAVRSAAGSVDRSLLPSLDMVSLEEGFVALQRGLYRVATSMAGVMTLLSLALAGVGIYGVMAFLVSQQTREIGIRVALGARSRLIVKNILRQGLRPVLIGMAIGFALGAAANVIERATEPFPDTLARTIFGDWSIYGGLAMMLGIAVLASVIPARRALRVDPAVTLRHE
jgi:macrolide transport system ATP-binding/permease protein